MTKDKSKPSELIRSRLRTLENKYLIADGLMVSAQNKSILEGMLPSVEIDFDALMTECVMLADGDALPGTDATKSSVMISKLEFDSRVRDWLNEVGSGSKPQVAVGRSSSGKGVASQVFSPDDQKPPAYFDNNCDESVSKYSKYSTSSTKSQIEFKRKEGQVKVKVATLANELETKKYQYELKSKLKLDKARQELELARQKLAEMQEDAERENRRREREYELEIATVEARAWQEVEHGPCGFDGSDGVSPELRLAYAESGNPSARGVVGVSKRGFSRYPSNSPSSEPRAQFDYYDSYNRNYNTYNKDRVNDKDLVLGLPERANNSVERMKLYYGKAPNSRGEGGDGSGPSPNREGDYGDWMRTGRYETAPKLQNYNADDGYPTPGEREHMDQPPYQTQPNRETVAPRNRSYGATVANPPVVHDYPPPRPEIKCFDGDPLNYWSFVRSFDTHIAQRMSSDSAKLVYLLQHCTPKVRSNLEHFSRDAEMGYRLARESLFNDYGQPYIIAHSCERKLLECPKLKDKDPAKLKTLTVLMDKCLAMLVDIQEFATLNSLGTIQKITEKLPEQMQRDWVKWSYQTFCNYGKQAKFPELVEFVRRESDEVNSFYGKVFYSTKRPLISSPPRNKRNAVFSAATTNNDRPMQSVACLFCKKSHSLNKCKDFTELSRRKRVEFLKRNRCCFRCLKVGHMLDKCSEKVGCTVDGCTGKHHTVLHMFVAEDQRSSSDSHESEKVFSSVSKGCSVRGPVPYFMTLPVKVRCGREEVVTYALLDSGSQRTFCEKSLARRLNARGPEKEVPLTTLTSDTEGSAVNGMVVSLVVSDLGGKESIKIRDVLTIDRIPLEARPKPDLREFESWSYLEGVSFSEIEDKSVGILIGLDAHEVFRPLETRFGPDGAPDAIKTPLGWILFGAVSDKREKAANSSCMHVTLREQADSYLPLEEQVNSCGLDGESSREDRLSFKQMKETVKLVDGHLELPLLVRNRNVRLPNNRAMAENRLKSLKRRLTKNKELHQRYVATMQSYIEKGFAEPLNGETEIAENIWYLPHQPVINPKKPEKLRVVFDCAARYMGTSLNDQLMNGPHLTNTLVGVLTRFRMEQIALVSDIEAMFHQVRVKPHDRDLLRFLWWPNGELSRPAQPYRMKVHLFGASSSPSCAAFCLRQTVVMYGDKYSEKTADTIRRNFYVDDCLVSCETPERAITLIKEMMELLKACGFRLTKWMSNHPEVNLAIPEKDRSSALTSLPLDGSVSDRVLGVHWDVGEDSFRIISNVICREATRRGILATSHSIFDPLGFLAPVLIEPKLLLRELGDRGWDEPIGDDQSRRWKTWLASLEYLESLKIPRCFKPANFEGKLVYELHHFADASRLAYGAVSYLRIEDERGNVHCSFVIGKGHLAPTSVTTIPRLELLAAVCALRLDEILRRELEFPIGESYFWSDSTAVLQSIYNSRKRFPVFVANRLAEIERKSKIASWRYVPSEINPADEVSRGVKSELFVKSSDWLQGPQFLWESRESWPKQLDKLMDLPDEFPMLERKVTVCTSLCAIENTELPANRFIGYFSTWHRLKKATAWLIRYFQYLRLKHIGGNGSSEGPLGELCVTELQVAEMRLVRYVQKAYFPRLYRTLLTNKTLTAIDCSKSLRKLSPRIDNELLRVGGRINNAPVEYETRHPIILPADSHLTRLVVNHYHASVGHAGVRHTFCALVQRYWVETPSSVIRRVIDDCVACRKQGAKPCTQIMAELPLCRLQMGQSPFFLYRL